MLFLFVAAEAAFAQDESSDAIHWAYGAHFGTGAYRLGNDEVVYLFSARPGHRIRRAHLDPAEGRQIGIEISVPVSLGLYKFDPEDLGGVADFDNLSTLSAVPGIDVDIPVSERLSLKPNVHAGLGTQLDGGDTARIYWGGIKSRWRFAADGFDWAFVSGLSYIGYSAGGRNRGSALPLLTAVEFDHPLKHRTLNGQPLRLHWHVAHTNYLNSVEFDRYSAAAGALDDVTLNDEWEIGVAFSIAGARLKLWRFSWDRVGLTYRLSGDGFEAVGLTFRSIYDR